MKYSLATLLWLMLFTQVFAQGSRLEPAATTYTLPRFESLQKAQVVRTVDGDSLELLIGNTVERCRLAGIDCPELKGNDRETFYGREAAWFTFNLLAGESVWFESDPNLPRDTFGRMLVFVYRAPDGLFVNLELLRQGYARVYDYDHARKHLFKSYEVRARKAMKGMWNPNVANYAGASAAIAPDPETAPRTINVEREATSSPPPVAPVAIARPPANAAAATVYVTKSGSKYHAAGCRSLSKSAIPISLRNAVAKRLQPCSVCKPDR